MSDSSPRWPGTNGSPGLDFSPRPSNPDAGAGSKDAAAGVNGSQGVSGDSRSTDRGSAAPGSESGENGRPSGHRPTPPPFESPAQSKPSQGGAAFSAPTPTRGADAATSASSQSSAEPRTGQDPKVQESAASWAWQPLGAEPDAAPQARGGSAASAASAGAAEGATTVRPVAAGAASAAAAGVGISSAAARAANQAKQTTSRRTTPSPATSTPSAATRRTGTRRTRKARLRLARLDPWSVMKTTFLFSIAFGIILMVVAWVLWTVLAGSGALDSLNQFMTTLIGQEGEQFNVENYVNGPRVLGAAAVLAAIDIVILTAVATLFAFLYNLAATVIGGLEVTLAED